MTEQKVYVIFERVLVLADLLPDSGSEGLEIDDDLSAAAAAAAVDRLMIYGRKTLTLTPIDQSTRPVEGASCNANKMIERVQVHHHHPLLLINNSNSLVFTETEQINE